MWHALNMFNSPVAVRDGLEEAEAKRAAVLLVAMGIEAGWGRSHSGVGGWEVAVPAEDCARADRLLIEEDHQPERVAEAPPPVLLSSRLWLSHASVPPVALALLCIAIHLWVHGGAGPSPRSRMIEAGAIVSYLVSQGQWWRLLTAVFLHFDISHLVSNMFALLIIGPALVAEVGIARFVAVFVATGVFGNVVSQLLNDTVAVKAGASGAICGIMGALAGLSLASLAGSVEVRRPAWRTLGALTALFGLTVGFQPGRDHYAHIGGVVSGLLLGRSFLRHRARVAGGAATSVIVRTMCLLIALCIGSAVAAAALAEEPAAQAAQAIAEQTAPAAIGKEPAPGTIVSRDNLDAFADVLGPSIQWSVRRGMRMEVIAPRQIPLEPARLEATQKYYSQCALSKDRNRVDNYVAGLPFPLINDNDPDIAIKLMFDFENRIVVDDLDVRNFECDTGGLDATTGLHVERHFLMGHFRRLYYVSRLYHDPKPTWQTEAGIRYREVLHPILEPFDLKGVGVTYNRYLDPFRQDDSWLYYPLLKRVRRLSSAQRSDALFGQDADIDSYGGYAGNPAWMNWRLLGTKRILAPMHTSHFPARWSPGAANFLFDDTWEMRDVYVIEGVSRLPQYAYSKRIVYLDRHSFVIPYTEMYDHNGALWKAWINQWKIGRKAFPEAKRAVYDYEQQFIPALSIFDMQLEHATRCLLPSPSVPGEEGWYFNFGDAEGTVEDVFLISNIIASGR